MPPMEENVIGTATSSPSEVVSRLEDSGTSAAQFCRESAKKPLSPAILALRLLPVPGKTWMTSGAVPPVSWVAVTCW